MPTVAIYARVSTDRQDLDQRIDELETFAEQEYPEATVQQYIDTVAGTATDGSDEYQRLRADIRAGDIDAVILRDISRLSPLGGGEIHSFIQFALKHDTSVRDLEVGLSVDVEDSMVDSAVTQMIADIMGDLARIEQKQEVRRIQSGIEAAQDAGKWTGQSPRGFEVVDGRLRVDIEEFLRIRVSIERVASGETVADVAEDTGLSATALRDLYQDRADLYLHGNADDDRVDAVVDDIQPLDEPKAEPEEFEDQVQRIIRDELGEDA